jgi:hypothetical protein
MLRNVNIFAVYKTFSMHSHVLFLGGGGGRWDSSVSKVTGYHVERQGSFPGTDKDFFVTMSTPALGSTNTPIQ